MNKLIRAAGMLSLGTASLAVQTSVLAESGDKPWSVSAALKGFYDDNIYTRPSGPNKIDSFGFEVSPSLKYTLLTDDSVVKLGYTYSAKYYDAREDDNFDQGHLLSAALKHSFSPRFTLELSDRFAVAQEPEQLGGAGLGGTNFRANGDNKSNRAQIAATIGLTSRFGVVVGYRNTFFDYDDPAYQDSLNRMEHEPSLDLRFQLQPSTVLVAGYSYSIVDFDENASYDRDNDSHFLKVGIDQKFTQELSASARVGIQIVDYANPIQSDVTSPYADASVKYAFTPASSLTAGLTHQHNATDVLAAQDQESTLLYLVLAHDITAKLRGKIILQYQNSEFISSNPLLDGQTEDIISAGLNLTYAVTANIGLEASYYYDRLNSPIVPNLLQEREFARNRVFLGVRFSY